MWLLSEVQSNDNVIGKPGLKVTYLYPGTHCMNIKGTIIYNDLTLNNVISSKLQSDFMQNLIILIQSITVNGYLTGEIYVCFHNTL